MIVRRSGELAKAVFQIVFTVALIWSTIWRVFPKLERSHPDVISYASG